MRARLVSLIEVEKMKMDGWMDGWLYALCERVCGYRDSKRITNVGSNLEQSRDVYV